MSGPRLKNHKRVTRRPDGWSHVSIAERKKEKNSDVRQIMQELNIIMKIENIQNMSRIQFRKLTKIRCEEATFSDLILKKKKGSKGRKLEHGAKLEMSDYLCPNDQLTVDDQRLIFQIRSQSNPLPANRGDPQPCSRGCGEIQDNCHIIQCSMLNKEDQGEYKGDAVNPIVNTVLPHDIFKDWVWRQLGMDGKRLFAQQHGHNRHE